MEEFDDVTEINNDNETETPEDIVENDNGDKNTEVTVETDNKENEGIDIKGDMLSKESIEIKGDTLSKEGIEVKGEALSKEDIEIKELENKETDVKEKQNIENSDKTSSKEKEELKEYLEKESPYSREVNEYISSKEELELYKEASLVERNIDGRICLIREDLDLNYIDKESGLTNEKLIAKGRSPYDAKTGERIELHHIGQDFNAPFAELKSVSEHDLYSKTLHKSEMDSWRRDPEKVSEYSAQRKAHWKSRI